MRVDAKKSLVNRNRAAANEPEQRASSGEAKFEFVDERPESVQLRNLQLAADKYSSPANTKTSWSRGGVVQRTVWRRVLKGWQNRATYATQKYNPANLPEQHPEGRPWREGDEWDDAALPTASNYSFEDETIVVAHDNDDSIVVGIDKHQNKHQRYKIPGLPQYEGGSGSKFSKEKDLDWHRNNTAQAMLEWARSLLPWGGVKQFMAKKERDGGIIYDASAEMDGTILVVAYHCNPKKDGG